MSAIDRNIPHALGVTQEPIGIFIQPACLQHKYIRHSNASHVFERPERLRAVLLGVAAAAARLEDAERTALQAIAAARGSEIGSGNGQEGAAGQCSSAAGEGTGQKAPKAEDDLSNLLSSLNLAKSPSPASISTPHPRHLHIVPPPTARPTGQTLLHHPALQLAHSPPPEEAIPYLPRNPDGSARRFGPALPSSEYLKELLKWATEAPEQIKATGCEIPAGRGLNQGDLYLGPGSVLAIEGAVGLFSLE